jgi:hypothetical protein
MPPRRTGAVVNAECWSCGHPVDFGDGGDDDEGVIAECAVCSADNEVCADCGETYSPFSDGRDSGRCGICEDRHAG